MIDGADKEPGLDCAPGSASFYSPGRAGAELGMWKGLRTGDVERAQNQGCGHPTPKRRWQP